MDFIHPTFLKTLISKYDFGPVNLPGFSRNRPQATRMVRNIDPNPLQSRLLNSDNFHSDWLTWPQDKFGVQLQRISSTHSSLKLDFL